PGSPAAAAGRLLFGLPAAGLRALCMKDASAHPGIARLARAAGDLAEQSGDRDDAIRWYRRAADLDDPDAITLLYWLARNAAPPPPPADQNALMAVLAASHYPMAVLLAGDDYESGKTVPVDPIRALALY